MSGQDTEPGATFFQVYGSMLEKAHDPIFAKIDLDIDVNARKAHFIVPNVVESRGEPIINPVTKKEHRAQFNMPDGFELPWPRSDAAGRRQTVPSSSIWRTRTRISPS